MFMKKVFSTIILTFCFLISYGQSLILSTEEVDKRVYFKLSESDIKNLLNDNPKELTKINFIASQSYIFIPFDKSSDFNINTINVFEVEHLRYENIRREVIVSRNNDKIQLLSKKELNEKLKELFDKHKK